jgi:hypothetical protein
MAILTSSDTTYLPSGLKASGANLNNLLLRSQSLAESPSGAARNLEIHTRADQFDFQIPNRGIQIAPYTVQLREWPVSGNTTVSVKWGWKSGFEILDSNYYELSQDIGRLTIYCTCKELKVEYQSGFDFNVSTRTTEDIRYLIGQLALVLEQLDLNIAEDDARSQLGTYLQPFRKYRTLL